MRKLIALCEGAVMGPPVARLRAVGVLEGISFLALLGIAMPLKYLAGMPGPVLVVGWAHGVLFVLYLAAVAHAALAGRWSLLKVFAALAASVLPFGPFVFDAWYLKEAPPRGPLPASEAHCARVEGAEP